MSFFPRNKTAQPSSNLKTYRLQVFQLVPVPRLLFSRQFLGQYSRGTKQCMTQNEKKQGSLRALTPAATICVTEGVPQRSP